MPANRTEVKRMFLTEYNEAKTLAQEREEGFVEGYVEGFVETYVKNSEKATAECEAEGMLLALLHLIEKGMISEAQAADKVHMSVEEFREQAKLA